MERKYHESYTGIVYNTCVYYTIIYSEGGESIDLTY